MRKRPASWVKHIPTGKCGFYLSRGNLSKKHSCVRQAPPEASCGTTPNALPGCGAGSTPDAGQHCPGPGQSRSRQGRHGPQRDLPREHGSWRGLGGKQRIHHFQDNRTQCRLHQQLAFPQSFLLPSAVSPQNSLTVGPPLAYKMSGSHGWPLLSAVSFSCLLTQLPAFGICSVTSKRISCCHLFPCAGAGHSRSAPLQTPLGPHQMHSKTLCYLVLVENLQGCP